MRDWTVKSCKLRQHSAALCHQHKRLIFIIRYWTGLTCILSVQNFLLTGCQPEGSRPLGFSALEFDFSYNLEPLNRWTEVHRLRLPLSVPTNTCIVVSYTNFINFERVGGHAFARRARPMRKVERGQTAIRKTNKKEEKVVMSDQTLCMAYCLV